MKTAQLKEIEHRGKTRIAAFFSYDAALVKLCKEAGLIYSNTHRCWYTDYNDENINKLTQLFKETGFIDISELSVKKGTVVEENGKEEAGSLNPAAGNLQPAISIKQEAVKSKQEAAGSKHEEVLSWRETADSGQGYNKMEVVIEVTNKKLILKMPKNDADIKFINTFQYRRWNKDTFRWEIPNYRDNLELLKQYFGERISEIKVIRQQATSDSQYSEDSQQSTVGNGQSAVGNGNQQLDKDKGEKKAPSAEIKQQIHDLRKWMEHKRYSTTTIETYTEAVQIFLNFVEPKKAFDIEAGDMVRFVNEYIIGNSLSYSYQNQFINGAKLFFREVIKSPMDVEKFERPRRQHRLPNVLSKEEVAAILKAHTNMKHSTMLSLIYACGLRRSELINLRPMHVDSKRHLLIIINSKGKKDRVVPISDKVIEMLREYYKQYKPQEWLFEGQYKGEKYSEQSLQKVLKSAVAIAKIKKPVSLHWLRHSYATHLMDSGTDLRYIQELLGHKSSKTTEIYTHVTTKSLQNIKSPFDDL